MKGRVFEWVTSIIFIISACWLVEVVKERRGVTPKIHPYLSVDPRTSVPQ